MSFVGKGHFRGDGSGQVCFSRKPARIQYFRRSTALAGVVVDTSATARGIICASAQSGGVVGASTAVAVRIVGKLKVVIVATQEHKHILLLQNFDRLS